MLDTNHTSAEMHWSAHVLMLKRISINFSLSLSMHTILIYATQANANTSEEGERKRWIELFSHCSCNCWIISKTMCQYWQTTPRTHNIQTSKRICIHDTYHTLVCTDGTLPTHSSTVTNFLGASELGWWRKKGRDEQNREEMIRRSWYGVGVFYRNSIQNDSVQ